MSRRTNIPQPVEDPMDFTMPVEMVRVVKTLPQPIRVFSPDQPMPMNQTARTKEERDWAPFVGMSGLHMTIGDFIGGYETEWLWSLCSTINDMFPDKRPLKPTDNNRTVRSYRDTISALVENLGNLCCSYPDFCNLEVALEYVIPGEFSDPARGISGTRADAVVFGKDRVAVLEFKTGHSTEDMERQKAQAIGQVNGYLRGLHKWHRHAHPKNLRACVVMFALNDVYEKAEMPPKIGVGFQTARIVSRNNLFEFLRDCFVGHFTPVANPHRWLHSFESMGTPHEDIFLEIADDAANHFEEMPELDGNEKAAIRRRIARRLGLSRTWPLKPLIVALTNGQWELRDAVVQLLEKLPQDQLEVLFEGWQNQKS